MKQSILAAVLIALALSAAQTGAEDSLLAPPELPPSAYRGETVGPEVTIVETGRETIYEYRVRGQLYMVKVQPLVGPPYYLLDTTGDGRLDVRRDRVWSNELSQWMLFSW
ncbi:MAG: DUF2782 domain-containing protein [Candidatus Thiosymbion ectosymbiont of Robbea hypermnestra]|nr:DUF2782 domain-containing protein [Candidatus Thiosymbion ectosymbiont of Robbea hypermnestra]